MCDKEMIFNLIINAGNELIKSNTLIYPDGTTKDYRPTDFENYRHSLLKLIDLSIPFYMRLRELKK